MPDGIGSTNAYRTAIKLFGRTVMVAEVEKPILQDTNVGRENLTIEDHNKLDEPSPLNENQDTQLSLGKIYNAPIPFGSVRSSPECESKPYEARKSQRGFVPYKRCASESKVKSVEVTTSSNQQAQIARVCS